MLTRHTGRKPLGIWSNSFISNSLRSGRFPHWTSGSEAIISITLGERFNLWRTIVNRLGGQLVIRQLLTTPGLLYGELAGDLTAHYGLTMTVFENGNAMTTFRDRGAHRLVMALLSWVFFSGQAQAYFLTFSAHGQIPTAAEARALALEHGRFFDGGKLMRPASKPVWGKTAS